tara:strand:+ start:3401 stop:3859 length:459 start_codon:yes stop_codon:yes gene_type:complete
MKAYLIDPIKRIVSVVDYNGDYKKINKFIDAEIFTAVYPLKNEDTLYVDDMGLMKQTNHAFDFRYENGHTQTLFGKTLVLGANDEGESVDVKSTIAEITQRITWCGKVLIMQSAEGFEVMPISSDVQEAKIHVLKEKVNEKIDEIFHGGKND